MNETIPDLPQFTATVERVLGRKLTVPEQDGASDFWKCMDGIGKGVSQHTYSLHIDSPVLYAQLPRYSPYHTIKDIADILMLVPVFILYFYWIPAVVLFISGILLHKFAKYVRDRDVSRFTTSLKEEIAAQPYRGGIAKLCAYYLLGIVLIMSPKGSVHWPQFVSNLITGEKRYIDEARRIEVPERGYLSFLVRRIKHD